MSDRTLKVVAGLCAGVLALMLTLALAGGMIAGMLRDGQNAAYSASPSVGIIGGADGPTAIFLAGSSRRLAGYSLLAGAVALAGLIASVATLRRRRQRR